MLPPEEHGLERTGLCVCHHRSQSDLLTEVAHRASAWQQTSIHMIRLSSRDNSVIPELYVNSFDIGALLLRVLCLRADSVTNSSYQAIRCPV